MAKITAKPAAKKTAKTTEAPKNLEALAKRWLAGEEMKVLAKEAKISWPTLAGHLIAAGYRRADRKKPAKAKKADEKKGAKTHPADAPKAKRVTKVKAK